MTSSGWVRRPSEACARGRWAVAVILLGCSKAPPPPEPRQDAPPILASALARLDDAGFLVGAEETGDFLADERRLLRQLHLAQRTYGPADPRVSKVLGALADLYDRHNRADEYSNVRALMLEAWARRQSADARPMPPPGGPFARPGLHGYDGEKQSPPSLLSHWMNRRVTPELYEDTTYEKVVARLEANAAAAATRGDALEEAKAHESLANTHAAMAAFGSARTNAHRALELRRKVLGDQHELTLRSERTLAAIPDFDAR